MRPRPAPRAEALLLATLLLAAALPLACAKPADPRPSVVLVVIDTLRADAVSGHGAVEGTTPTLDALAAEGLDYRHAYSPSSWTLPSHASLFTGVGVERHRLGMSGRLALAEEEVTVAERFAAAGYQTAAFSENMLVSDVFQMLQGFAYRRTNQIFRKGENDLPMDVYWHVDLETNVRQWLEKRDPSRPFFLFVNMFDAHRPYEVRDENPWVTTDLSRDEMRRYAHDPQEYLCAALPPPEYLETLHGLYLGDVAVADAKVKVLLDQVRELAHPATLLTVVTSDHGELFGERGLLGHEFSLRNGALHVPLIVQGLPDTKPATIDAPVTLVDVTASLLAWTGLDVPPDLEGRVLPTTPGEATSDRVLEAAYNDSFVIAPEAWEGVLETLDKSYPRRACGPDDKVFGGMATLYDPPFKLHWFERYPPELYDLSWDPDERSDLAPIRPDLVQAYSQRIAGFVAEAGITGTPQAPAEPAREDAVDALRALGYVQ